MPVVWIDRHAESARSSVSVRGEAGHHVDAWSPRDAPALCRSSDRHRVRLDRRDRGCSTATAMLPSVDPVLEVGKHPRLDLLVERRTEMHERDARPGSPQIECRLRGRIPAADDDHVLMERLVPLAIQACVTCGRSSPGTPSRLGEPKYPVATTTACAFVLWSRASARSRCGRRSRSSLCSMRVTRSYCRNGMREVPDNAAIVRERVATRRLRRSAIANGMPAERELLGRREESHVRGILRDRAARSPRPRARSGSSPARWAD